RQQAQGAAARLQHDGGAGRFCRLSGGLACPLQDRHQQGCAGNQRAAVNLPDMKNADRMDVRSAFFFAAFLVVLALVRRPTQAGSGSGLPSAVVFRPPSTYMISAVIPLARSESMKAAALPTSSMVILRRSGALCALYASSLPKLPMPDAASVLIGPAETALARIPCGPRQKAR